MSMVLVNGFLLTGKYGRYEGIVIKDLSGFSSLKYQMIKAGPQHNTGLSPSHELLVCIEHIP
jgi:hypothetical protein